MAGKKAMELSMNVIIVAAIALIVLVVISIIFTGKLGDFNKGFKSCENKNGFPVDKVEECTSQGGAPLFKYSDDKTEKYCCVIITGDKEK